jgi:hypothetical protein
MARGRFISKAISLDEKIDSLSSDTVRLLFTWLITHLDCEGRMYGDAQTVKSIVFPRRNMKASTIEKYLVELESAGLILRYFGNTSLPQKRYLLMPNFEKHQPGLRKDKEAQSQIPPFTPDQGRSKDVNGLTQVKDKVKDKEYIYSIFNHWNQQNIIVHKKLTDDMKSAINRSLINHDFDIEGVKTAISNYAEIVLSEDYFFRYKWTLKDFLRRGLEKFMDLEIAKANFRRDRQTGENHNPRELPKTWTDSPNYTD